MKRNVAGVLCRNLLIGVLCLAVCFWGYTENTKAEDDFEMTIIQTHSPFEFINQMLTNLDDPDITLDSLYRALMVASFLQNSPYQKVSYAPTIKEVCTITDITGVQYTQCEGVSMEFDSIKNETIIFNTTELEMPGGISLKIYSSRMSVDTEEVTKEAIQAKITDIDENEYVDKIEIILDEQNACSVIVCNFIQSDNIEVSP